MEIRKQQPGMGRIGVHGSELLKTIAAEKCVVHFDEIFRLGQSL